MDSITAPDDPATEAACVLLGVDVRLALLLAGADDEVDVDGAEVSIKCDLLVKTRFESFLSVCVKFLEASASAGLSVLSNGCSELLSPVERSSTTVVGSCFGLITILLDGLWWNGIGRGGAILLE